MSKDRGPELRKSINPEIPPNIQGRLLLFCNSSTDPSTPIYFTEFKITNSARINPPTRVRGYLFSAAERDEFCSNHDANCRSAESGRSKHVYTMRYTIVGSQPIDQTVTVRKTRK